MAAATESRSAPQGARRRLLIAALAAAGTRLAQAAVQDWPTRPIRILVAYPAGGVSDQVARDLARRLESEVGVPVVVENRPGASGVVALERLARSAADGHTLAFAAATAVAIMRSGPRHRGRNALPVQPVAGVMRTPVLVVGTPALQARTFGDMLAQARTRGGAIRWATTGEGTTGHRVLERVRRDSGAHIVHVPYKGGGQQISDALAGHFEVLSTNVASQQLEAIRAGRLTALAVGAPARLPVLPGTPTLAELGFPRANLDSLFGLFSPLQTPPDRVVRLNTEIAAALRHSELRDKLLSMSNVPYQGTATEFAKHVLLEAER